MQVLVLHESAVDLSAEEFLAVLRFAWPIFIQVEECILLEQQYAEDNYQSWRDHFGDDWSGIELIINHLHVRDHLPDENDEDTLLAVGRFLQETWRAAARRQFPSREFNIDLTNEEADHGPTLYMTTIRESPPRGPLPNLGPSHG